MGYPKEIIIEAPAVLDPDDNFYDHQPFQSEIEKLVGNDPLQTAILRGMLTVIVRNNPTIREVVRDPGETNSRLQALFSDYDLQESTLRWNERITGLAILLKRNGYKVTRSLLVNHRGKVKNLLENLNNTYPDVYRYLSRFTGRDFYNTVGTKTSTLKGKFPTVPSYPAWLQQQKLYQVVEDQQAIQETFAPKPVSQIRGQIKRWRFIR